MMDNFKKKFVEEATDLLNSLESNVLLLEKDTTNQQIISEIFRVMHSLKGGGSMFGFENISEYTHNLETVYDQVRNFKILVNKELLDITFASVDHIRNLLSKDEQNNPAVVAENEKLLNRILNLLNKSSQNDEPIESEIVEKINQEKVAALRTYYIVFKPSENIFDNGTNPLFLLDELNSLGNCRFYPRIGLIPNLSEFNGNKCYIHWDIFIAANEEQQNISDVFIFVEDESDINVYKLSDINLLIDNDFTKQLDEIAQLELGFDVNEILDFLNPQKKTEVAENKSTDDVDSKKKNKDNVISSVRVATEKLDQLMNLVSELVTTQARLSLYAEQNHNSELISISENVENLTRQLRDIAFNISLIPIETILNRFHRLVRDLSSELKKEVTFITEGAETELDKTLMQNLTDPILHIIRNSIDHGIEMPTDREENGKPRQGKIHFRAYYSGANVHIKISDDGKGLDHQRIKQKAISRGIITADAELSEKEALALIFLPGFSTSEKVTDVSGRGVGLDVVKRKIAEVHGEVEVDSKPNEGTTFTIKIPLTLSIIDGLLVKVHETQMIIPLSVVDKIYAVEHQKLSKAFKNIIAFDGVQIPFLYLRNEFQEVENQAIIEEVVVVKYEDKKMGLAVDSVIGEYQAVLKPLGRHYKDQDIISGATILGDGSIALVLDTNRIINKFTE